MSCAERCRDFLQYLDSEQELQSNWRATGSGRCVRLLIPQPLPAILFPDIEKRISAKFTSFCISQSPCVGFKYAPLGTETFMDVGHGIDGAEFEVLLEELIADHQIMINKISDTLAHDKKGSPPTP